MTATVTDLFCGAGGSGLGAEAAGATLQLAANHSELAVETHAANFPRCEHDVADISQVQPQRYRRSDILWASPECTWQSGARGRRRDDDPQQMLFGADDPNDVAERSRSTMWDVPRFAEWHHYDAVIVENVVEAVTKWPLWPAWVLAMQCLGYRVEVVSLNSMHAPAIVAPRAPQSRDRIYAVCTPAGSRGPDLDPRPRSWCPGCRVIVDGVQWWKRWPAPLAGKYGPQYLYRCPACRNVVAPLVVPAAAVIDWSDPGVRIGDRPRPLRPATMERIQAGLDRFAGPALVPAGGTWNTGPVSVDEPMRTRTTRETDALVVPYYGTGVARTSDRPMPTMTTVDTAGLAFIATARGGGSKKSAHTADAPLTTVTTSGNHHMLVRHNTARYGRPGAELCTPTDEPARTLTTAGHQSLVGWPGPAPRIEDCSFRMLGEAEIAGAMAFRPEYVIKGSRKSDRVKQLGNAVTPPAAEFLIRAVMASLDGVS